MARRDSFLLRTDPEVMRSLKRWAQDDLRSMNSQIEFVLRRALREQGRLKQPELSVDQTSDSGVRR